MLTRQNIIDIMKKLNFKKDQYWIVSGAAMVLHSVKDTTRDIDIGCTKELFEKLLQEGYSISKQNNLGRVILIGSQIEMMEEWPKGEVEEVEGFTVQSIRTIREQKLMMGREKDFKDIELIDLFSNLKS